MQAHLAPLHLALRKLQHELKAVSSEMDQMSTAASLMAGASNRILQMQHKAQALQSCIDQKLKKVHDQEQQLAAACKASDAVTQGLVRCMLMEHETGGNIRSALFFCAALLKIKLAKLLASLLSGAAMKASIPNKYILGIHCIRCQSGNTGSIQRFAPHH